MKNLLLEHYISTHEPIIQLSGDVLKLKNEITFYQKFLDSIKPSIKKLMQKKQKKL